MYRYLYYLASASCEVLKAEFPGDWWMMIAFCSIAVQYEAVRIICVTSFPQLWIAIQRAVQVDVPAYFSEVVHPTFENVCLKTLAHEFFTCAGFFGDIKP